MKSFHGSHRKRSGYTLFEMLTVQALLVALVAISWPALRSPLGKNQLLDAARQVRVELVKARHEAIETGVAQEFRFQRGAREFEIRPVGSRTEGASFLGTHDRNRSSTLDLSNFTEAGKDITRIETRRELPENIKFCDLGAKRFEEERVEDTSDSFAVLDNSESFEEEEWSHPIYFYPNGRTSNAKIRLQGKKDFEVEVALRGLTGIPTIGEVRRPEKEQP